jgi:hypothetical protein
MTSPGAPQNGAHRSVWPYIGVGCLTVTVGFFGGVMIAALVAKIVGSARGCVPPEGFPACNTWSFVLPGALLGAVVLPAAALRRLRESRTSHDPDQNS